MYLESRDKLLVNRQATRLLIFLGIPLRQVSKDASKLAPTTSHTQEDRFVIRSIHIGQPDRDLPGGGGSILGRQAFCHTSNPVDASGPLLKFAGFHGKS